MLGRQRGAEARLFGTPRILFTKQPQDLVAKRARLGAVRLPARAAMLQAAGSFESVSPPQTLGLAVTQRQHLGSVHQPQRFALYSTEHFQTVQLPRAHGCPLHGDPQKVVAV